MYEYPSGVWPVMLTPYRLDGQVDLGGLAALTRWYIDGGASGLFAACQSSEIFHLTQEERQRIVHTAVEAAGGDVPVIASGHVSEDVGETLEEMRRMMGAGAAAFILISNRLCPEAADEAAWLAALDVLLRGADASWPLGVYECPYPYKRLMTDAMLDACAHSGRFAFMKDTCCDAETIRGRVRRLQGTPMRLYNANSATLLPSLLDGAAGFSGIMASFHPRLYAWLCDHPTHPNAQAVQDVLSVASQVEGLKYPVCAKYHLAELEGLPITPYSRAQDWRQLTRTDMGVVHSIDRLCQDAYDRYCIQEERL